MCSMNYGSSTISNGRSPGESSFLQYPRFEADEAAILTAVVTLSYAAWQYWQNILI